MQEGGPKLREVSIGGGGSVQLARSFTRHIEVEMKVVTNAHVLGIEFDGARAIEPATKWKKVKTSHMRFAPREVILCAGAMGSPHILELSALGEVNVSSHWVLMWCAISRAWGRIS